MSPDIKSEIEKILRQAVVGGVIQLTAPPNPDMGDWSFACFDLAKKNGKNPVETAKELANLICHPERAPQGRVEGSLRNKVFKDSSPVARNDKMAGGLIEQVQAAGPYVNFFFNAGGDEDL